MLSFAVASKISLSLFIYFDCILIDMPYKSAFGSFSLGGGGMSVYYLAEGVMYRD